MDSGRLRCSATGRDTAVLRVVRALLDTHAFLWWIADKPEISDRARETVEDERNEILFSVISGWEIAIKAGGGKLDLPDAPERFVNEQLSRNDIEVLPMYLNHALKVHGLPEHHRDPFDRLLVAQALTERLPLISNNRQIARYPVETIW